MPSPSSMTKEVLMKELREHGIKLPSPRSRKEVFWQLYEEQILKKAGWAQQDSASAAAVTASSPRRRRGRPKKVTAEDSPKLTNSEFSSDDDSSWITLNEILTPKRNLSSEKNKAEMEPDLTVNNISISSLSDDELYEMLRSSGAPVGPIVGTTRKLYERKLAKVLKGITDDYDEMEFSDEDSTYQHNTANRVGGDFDHKTSWNSTFPSLRHGGIPSPQPNAYKSLSHTSPYTRPTKLDRPTDVSEIVEQIREPPVGSHLASGRQSNGIPLWVKLMIIMLLVILVILVYQNMEDDSSNPIPYQDYSL